jgi:hypothetical protein
MEYVPYTIKWLELILRWGHVLFAILWVGNSFLFNYLDNKLNKDISSEEMKSLKEKELSLLFVSSNYPTPLLPMKTFIPNVTYPLETLLNCLSAGPDED